MGKTHYIVAGLGDADMVWLLSMGKLRTLKPGERLVKAGSHVEDLFFVTRGELSVTLADGSSVATLGEGAVIGEMSFVERQPPSTSVYAVDRAELLAIPRQAILERFESEPVFAARFYRALAVFLSERLRDTTAAVRASGGTIEANAMSPGSGDRFGRFARMWKGGSAPA
jgi:CRP-like cAMP-binding protein